MRPETGALVLLLLAYVATRIWRTSRNLHSAQSLPIAVKGRGSGLRFLRDGVQMLTDHYRTGVAFALPTPENYLILVSAAEEVQEVLAAPESHLSRRIIVQKQLQPRYTCDGWHVHLDMENNARLQQRVIKGLLAGHIEELWQPLQSQLWSSLEEIVTQCRDNGAVPLADLATNLVVETSCVAFFGEALAQDREFTTALRRGPETIFRAAALVKYAPKLLAPFVASLLTKNHRDLRAMEARLLPLIQSSLDSRGTGRKAKTVVDWLVDSLPKKEPWSAKQVFHLLFAYWLGVVFPFRAATFHALADLAEFQHIQDVLRDELNTIPAPDNELRKELDVLPLLDGFLKESGRMNQSDSVVSKREVAAPFHFSSGLQVPTTHWIAIPSRAIMRDASYYPQPEQFDLHRFRDGLSPDPSSAAAGDRKASRYTDGDERFPFWGLGKRMCPGRFFASVVLKMFVKEALETFDIRPADDRISRQRFVRTVSLLRPDFAIEVRLRT